jgi:putative hydrolase of HD superfamily
MTKPSIQRITELQQLIADFAKVNRVPQLADTGRAENDVEHSFGLALTCWFLVPKIAPELNLEKVLLYSLAHDVVEIHAGDTFTFGSKEMLDSKVTRERAAIKKLQADWPDFAEMTEYAQDYLDMSDEEAKFVYAVDKMLPVIMVNLGEKDKFWYRHKVTRKMQIEEKRTKMAVSPAIDSYFEKFVEWFSSPDYYYPENKRLP